MLTLYLTCGGRICVNYMVCNVDQKINKAEQELNGVDGEGTVVMHEIDEEKDAEGNGLLSFFSSF